VEAGDWLLTVSPQLASVAEYSRETCPFDLVFIKQCLLRLI